MGIHLLPPEVASQIAAGEVIERPASVVKELIENSLDAGAKHISIVIEAAGKRIIEVSDDGSGIPSGELPLAVERHATSKLSRAEELYRISTLGFRGEALASIASVSRLTITSRCAGEQSGTRLRVEGGKAEGPHSIAAPPGTQVRVEDLFYNVPARLKFLKSDTTERHHIDALVTRYALAFPHVRFHLLQDGNLVLHTSGNGDRREVLAALYGVEIARQMLKVDWQDGWMSVAGFISPLSLTRSNRREITFFVNRRPVQDVSLTTALVQAYHTLLMVGRYPLALAFLELPLEEVDVNVHPSKAEVRFRDPGRVFTALQSAVKRALLAHTPVPGVKLPQPWPFEQQRFATERPGIGSAEELPESLPGGEAQSNLGTPTAPVAQTLLSEEMRTPILRLVGQVAAAYLVAEGPDGLYLIDQHAAHERVLFEEFSSQVGAPFPTQTLLHPAVVDLPPATARLLNEHLPLLEKLGFSIEPFGPASYLVRALPALLAAMPADAALRLLVEDFEEDETPLQAEVEARLIARVCKRAAVKTGQVLTPEEQRSLLARLENCRSPRTCPHGRPTMIHLSVDLLERQFGRKGAR